MTKKILFIILAVFMLIAVAAAGWMAYQSSFGGPVGVTSGSVTMPSAPPPPPAIAGKPQTVDCSFFKNGPSCDTYPSGGAQDLCTKCKTGK